MFDLITLIKTIGYLGIFGIVFSETGLFIGFFLPGDSLLFTAGFLASQGFFNFWILAILISAGAVLGSLTGYFFGKKAGPLIFTKEDSLFFNKAHLERSRLFYEKHGAKTIVLARFLPVIRTFAPILAGVGQMRYAAFLAYNLIGGVLWGTGLPWLGFYLGNSIPNANKYILPIVILIIVISLLPTAIHILRDPNDRRRILRIFKRKPHAQ